MDIITAPFSAGSVGRNPGTKNAPAAILDMFKKWVCVTDREFSTLDITELTLNNSHISESQNMLYGELKKHKTGVVLGGDHSITYPCFKGWISHYKKPGIIIFDSHPDTVLNEKIPTHEDYLRSLIDQGFVDKKKVLLIAIRKIVAVEAAYLKKQKISCVVMDYNFDIKKVLAAAKKQFASCDGVYISLDIDSVDPAHAPGTGTPEPAGMTGREIMYAVDQLRNWKNVKMLDIVEVNPEIDVNNQTVKLAARLLETFVFGSR